MRLDRGRNRFLSTTMESEKDQERGEKRGVLSTGRAQKLGKTKDAVAESDRDDEEDDGAE